MNDDHDEESREDDNQEMAQDDAHDDEELENANDLDDDAFGAFCVLLLENDRSTKSYTTPPLDDEHAIRLQICLQANTYLTKLSVVMGPSLTTAGAKALGLGIQKSRIRHLTLAISDDLDQAPAKVVHTLLKCAMRTVKGVLFSCRLTEIEATKVAEILCLPTNSLVKMYLSISRLSLQTAQILAKGIRNSRIKELSMISLPSGDEEDDVMRIVYLRGIQNSRVRRLVLGGITGDFRDLEVVLPRIRCLDIMSRPLSVADMQLLTSGLDQARHLASLTLWHCNLTDEHIRVLASGIRNHQRIEALVLKENNVGDAGVLYLIESRIFASLTGLDLTNNNVGVLGAQRLLGASSTNNLKLQNLAMNSDIGYDGLIRLIGDELRANRDLQVLTLTMVANWVNYDDADSELAQAQELKRNQGTRALIAGLRANVHLRELNIKKLHLTSKATEEMEFYLEMNCNCGRHLLPMQHSLPVSLWCHVLAKFNDRASVLFYYLCELPMLAPGGDLHRIG